MASPIIDSTFKILPVGWLDWRNTTLEIGKRTVTSLHANNVVTKEAKSSPGPTITVNYPRGSMRLEVGNKGNAQTTRCSMASFIRIKSAERLTQFNSSNVQLYLVSFCCSGSYCWVIYMARQVGISAFLGVSLMLCMLIEQSLDHSTFKGGVVNGQEPIQKVVFKSSSSSTSMDHLRVFPMVSMDWGLV